MIMMSIIMLVIVIPFLLFEESIEQWWKHQQDAPPSKMALTGLVVLLLAGDILLPVPSSAVSTFAGWHLNWPLATAASWVGLTAGCILAFAAARAWGHRFALWFSKPDELKRVRALSNRLGPFLLILCRGVPVFAEASVLFMGMHGLSWRRFLLPVMLSNLGLSLFYSIVGQYAAENDLMSLALLVAIALPVLLVTIFKYGISGSNENLDDESD